MLSPPPLKYPSPPLCPPGHLGWAPAASAQAKAAVPALCPKCTLNSSTEPDLLGTQWPALCLAPSQLVPSWRAGTRVHRAHGGQSRSKHTEASISCPRPAECSTFTCQSSQISISSEPTADTTSRSNRGRRDVPVGFALVWF